MDNELDMDNSEMDLPVDPSDAFPTPFRSRACTWPLNRFQNEVPGESIDDGDGSAEGSGLRLHSSAEGAGSASSDQGAKTTPPNAGTPTSSVTHISPGGTLTSAGGKKNSSRRNPWGNSSYAELIAQAIENSPEKRLTLSQIYEYMVQNIEYFKDKGDSNSSAGWKNSIRHNLSLHNRFVRVQNEGTGKSSWWMINPDAKPGKSTRRRAATLDTQKYESKRRGRNKKQLDEQRVLGSDGNLQMGLGMTMRSPTSPISESTECLYVSATDPSSQQHHSPMHTLHPVPEGFRSRTGSNASSFGRLSPFEDGGAHTPTYSPHPWMTDYADHSVNRAEGTKIELSELDNSLAHSLRLQDNNNLNLDLNVQMHAMKESPRSQQIRPGLAQHSFSTSYSTWPTGGKTQENAVKHAQQKSAVDAKNISPGNGYTLSAIHTGHLSGGTFSSIPENDQFVPVTTGNSGLARNPTGMVPMNFRPVVFSLAQQQQNQPLKPNNMPPPPPSVKLAPIHDSTHGHVPMQNIPPMQNGPAMLNGQTGHFPADLMDIQSGAFDAVNVEEFLKHEWNMEGNLDFNLDQLGSFAACNEGSLPNSMASLPVQIQTTSPSVTMATGPKCTDQRFVNPHMWSS